MFGDCIKIFVQCYIPIIINNCICYSDSGKLYFYGVFDSTKVKRQSESVRRISEHLVTRIAKCGRTFVVFVTGMLLANSFFSSFCFVGGIEFEIIKKIQIKF